MSHVVEEGITMSQHGSLALYFLLLILLAWERGTCGNDSSLDTKTHWGLHLLKLPSADKLSMNPVYFIQYHFLKAAGIDGLLMAWNLAGPKSDYGNTTEGTESLDHPTSDQTQYGLQGKTASYGTEASDPQESYESGTGTGDATGYGATPTGSATDETPLSGSETQPAGHGMDPEDTCTHHSILLSTFVPLSRMVIDVPIFTVGTIIGRWVLNGYFLQIAHFC